MVLKKMGTLSRFNTGYLTKKNWIVSYPFKVVCVFLFLYIVPFDSVDYIYLGKAFGRRQFTNFYPGWVSTQ